MNTNRNTIHLMAGLALAAAFALLLCQPVMAEGEPPPEPAPEAPAPVQAAPAAPQPNGEGEVVAPEGGGGQPLATSELGILWTPYAWYYCSSEPAGDPLPGNGKCEETSLPNVALNFATNNGSGLVYLDPGFAEPLATTFTAIPKMTGMYTGPGGAATLGGLLTIQNFTSGYTLSGNTGMIGAYGLVSNGGVDFQGNSGALIIMDIQVINTMGLGIRVQNHNGSVSVTNTESSGNWSHGLEIDNTASASGAVTIKNSVFNRNVPVTPTPAHGMLISTKGVLTIEGVTASNNIGDGLNINAASKIAIMNSVFSNNTLLPPPIPDGDGIQILVGTATDVTLDNVQVNDNNMAGIAITTFGNITLTNIAASRNAYINVSLINSLALPDTKSVTVTNAVLNNSGGNGMDIFSAGKVTLNNITALANTGIGLNVMNMPGTSPVTILDSKGPNRFDSNTGGGLTIMSRGKLSLKGVTCIRNGAHGADIQNAAAANDSQSVTITNSVFDMNSTYGLQVISRGAISVTSVSANWNTGAWGASLNDSPSTTGTAVTVSGGDFQHNLTTGLVIQSNGAINVKGTNANQNSGMGADLQNPGGLGKPVTVSGSGAGNHFDSNAGFGMTIVSSGKVTLSKLTASNNQHGIDVVTLSAATDTYPVTLTNVSADFNSDGGIMVHTRGAATLTNVSASGNGTPVPPLPRPGLEVNNSFSTGMTSPPGITLKNIVTTGNLTDGTLLLSRGAITITGITSSNNSNPVIPFPASGAMINNSISPTYAPVTIKGSNSFDNNFVVGLNINSMGKVAVSNASVRFNAHGLDINNNAAVDDTRTVTLSNINIEHNPNSGLRVMSRGAITLTNVVESWANGPASAGGATLDNSFSLSPTKAPGVTVTKSSFCFNSNASGLSILTRGAVVMDSVNASYNTGLGANGASVSYPLGGVAPVTIKGTNRFDGNGQDGLFVKSYGTISLAGYTASVNVANGVVLDNWGAADDKQWIKVSSGVADANIFSGITALSRGVITASGLSAGNNNGIGIRLNNAFAAGNASIISASRLTVDRNFAGVDLQSKANVTVDSVRASGNGNYGVYVDTNQVGLGTGQVIFKNGSYRNILTGNGTHGLQIFTGGAVDLKGIDSQGNGNFLPNGDGINITAGDNNVPPIITIKISNSLISGNWGDGIEIGNSGFIPILPWYSGVLLFGNDIDGSGDMNQNVHP